MASPFRYAYGKGTNSPNGSSAGFAAGPNVANGGITLPAPLSSSPHGQPSPISIPYHSSSGYGHSQATSPHYAPQQQGGDDPRQPFYPQQQGFYPTPHNQQDRGGYSPSRPPPQGGYSIPAPLGSSPSALAGPRPVAGQGSQQSNHNQAGIGSGIDSRQRSRQDSFTTDGSAAPGPGSVFAHGTAGGPMQMQPQQQSPHPHARRVSMNSVQPPPPQKIGFGSGTESNGSNGAGETIRPDRYDSGGPRGEVRGQGYHQQQQGYGFPSSPTLAGSGADPYGTIRDTNLQQSSQQVQGAPSSPGGGPGQGRKSSPFADLFRRGRKSSNTTPLSTSPGRGAGGDKDDLTVDGGGRAPFEVAQETNQKRRMSPISFGARKSGNPSPTPSGDVAGSPNSFVVRSVTRQPGGVSVEEYASQYAPVSTTAGDGAGYVRQKSRPLSVRNGAGPTALGVPPGGPGGGLGYGTAQSSNDGRNEIGFGAREMDNYHSGQNEQDQRGRQGAPFHDQQQNVPATTAATTIERPTSPGNMSAQAFRRSSGTFRPASPSAKETTDVEAAAQQSALSISLQSNPSPLADPGSLRQKIGGPRNSPFPTSAATTSVDPTAGHTRRLSEQGVETAVTPVNAQGQMQSSPHRFGSPSSPSPGAGRFGATSVVGGGGRPSLAAIHGLPEPITIPAAEMEPGSPSWRSRRNSGAASPIGSVSPNGSGFLSRIISRDTHKNNAVSHGQPSDRLATTPLLETGASPGFTGFFKNLFGTSPKIGTGAEGGYDDGATGAQRQPGYGFGAGSIAGPAYGSSPVRGNGSYPSSPLQLRSSAADHLDPEQQAHLQKRESMRLASKIIDQERKRIIDSPTSTFDPTTDKPWQPRQALQDVKDDDDDQDADESTDRFGNGGGGGTDASPSRPGQQRWDKSHVNRKAVPRLSDPGEPADTPRQEDALSRLEGKLTPAQKIIMETRSKHMAQEQLRANALAVRQQHEEAQQQKQPHVTPVATPQRASTETPSHKVAGSQDRDPDVPVRRRTRSPTKKSIVKDDGTTVANKTEATVKPQLDMSAVNPQTPTPATAPKSSANGLLPGRGPLPSEFPSLPSALQEMMIRFYRFERYSVPLIRDIETRLLDVERDAQMSHSDTLSANSTRDREMDRWVGQMTSLMRHEIGQLQAATREIREGREILAVVAKSISSGRREPSAAFGAGATAGAFRPAMSKQEIDKLPVTPLNQVLPLPAPTSGALRETRDELGDLATVSSKKAEAGHADRTTNISSASFNSAVPVPRANVAHSVKSIVPTTQDAASLRSAQSTIPPTMQDTVSVRSARSMIPPAPPSPTKSALEVPADDASTVSHRRERSTSPSGRPRYTTALGEPITNGRLSPTRREASDGAASFLAEPPAAGRFDGPSRQFTASPTLSDTGSNASSTTRSRREHSVQDRIRSLVVSKLSEQPSSESIREQAHETEEAQEQEVPRSTAPASYSSMIRGADTVQQAPANAAESLTVQPPPESLHLKTPSATSRVSTSSDTTYSPHKTRTSPMLGGRLSPAADLGERQRSTSPTFVPQTGGTITTSSRAGSGVKARAQAFLQAQERANGDAESPSSINAPLPSPGTWVGGRYGGSPTKRSSVLGGVDGLAAPFTQLQPQAEARDDSALGPVLRNAVSHGEARPLNTDLKRSSTTAGPRSASSAAAIDPSSTSPRKSVIGPGASLKDRVAFFDSPR